ncbi:MATE family efflux transporter [Maritimibacter dapengensis]|uniref:MATE family efflux transporter n=1 Tax=Maritimibacter dapengensis TaxID=2836868 RepID=A0ABS6T0R4_9RHOB|nr:MATE family efflux transporter [Maritimibacter dapengensis]MBV7378785.1 MATE family efflux transporter [Maritimibacter dapengensis]
MAEARAITHRRVLAIALPIVAANVTVPILGAVDTGVVGQLGEAAPIGAVGLGATILTAIYWIFGFLRMGTAGLAAQALGAGDRGELAALLTRVLMIGLAGGAVLIAAQVPFFALAFRVAPASAEVEGLAWTYMSIRVWSAPAMIALFGLLGWLIAQERTRAVLMIQIAMNGVNIGLDLLFVLGFDWGVAGVAWATFLSEWAGLAFGLWLARAAFRVPDWRDWGAVFDRGRLVRMARVNSDILIRSLLLEVILVSFMFWGARFGDVTLAANQVLIQFLHLMAFGLDGFAFAAESLVGQALGGRDRARLRRAAILASQWGALVAVGFAVAFWVAGGAIIDVMTTAPEVRAAAREFLPWLIFAPLIGLAPFMFDGIFIGATRTADMRNMMLVSVAVYLLAALALRPLGNHGLWIAYLVSYAVRGMTLALRYPALERSAQD